MKSLAQPFHPPIHLLLSFFLILPGGKAAAQEVKEESSHVLPVRFVESGPVLDGKPDDTLWSCAVSDSSFHVLGQPHELSYLTTVRALYDSTFLYLLFECKGKHTRDIVATTVTRDGKIWERDDDVEVFFFPGQEESVYIQLLTNAIGAKLDLDIALVDNILKKHMGVDHVWEIQSAWNEDQWAVEMRIPLRQFVEKVNAGESWKVNFCRYLRLSDSNSLLTWSPADSSFHEPERFGLMRFEREVSFKTFEGRVDWMDDEKAALENTRKLHGALQYRIFRDYLNEITMRTHQNRTFQYLCREAIQFARLYPDSLDAIDIALRVIAYSGRRSRVVPLDMGLFAGEVEEILATDELKRDLFHLTRGLSRFWMDQLDEWEQVWKKLTTTQSTLAGTASFLVLINAREDVKFLQDALNIFIERVVRGKESLYIDPQLMIPSAKPARENADRLIYLALQQALHHFPHEVMTLANSISTDPEMTDDLKIVMTKLTFELVSNKRSPLFSPEASESLLMVLLPVEEKYASEGLSRYLFERMHEFERLDMKVAIDSIPQDVRRTATLRKHLKRGHPIDRILSLYFEAADSLEKAVEYMESSLEVLEDQTASRADAERRLKELKFRRDNRHEPSFFHVPRDSFRLVYKVGGYETYPIYLDITGNGKAVYYPRISQIFDPRADIVLTTPTEVDSPAVAFHIPALEIDSLSTLLVRQSFLKLDTDYSFPCEECSTIEITLYTPKNVRTVRFSGSDPDNIFSRVEIAISSLLEKYLRLASAHHHDWRVLSQSFRLLEQSAQQDMTPAKRLDILLELFTAESAENVLEERAWYVAPLLALAESTGRSSEVNAVIGVKYFHAVFRWKHYERAHVPAENDERLSRARFHFEKAISRVENAKEKEWYEFLSYFSENFAGPLEKLIIKTESLEERENRGNALSLLVWLACAKGDFTRAATLHEELMQTDVSENVRRVATIRMMIEYMHRRKNADALAYLDILREDFLRYLPENREIGDFRELDQYSRIDLLLDRAELLCKLGDIDSALTLLTEVDGEEIPEDRRDRYRKLLLLEESVEIPDVYLDSKAREYFLRLDALIRFERYERASEWAFWMKDLANGQNVSIQVMETMLRMIRLRPTWDELAKRLADAVFEISEEYKYQLRGDMLDTAISAVIRYGGSEEVINMWRDHIAPQELSPTCLFALEKLLEYFLRGGEIHESCEIFERLLRELPNFEDKISSIPLEDRQKQAHKEYALISSNYALELASLYMSELGESEDAIAIVDSLSTAMPTLSRDAYPFIFMALCDWKAEHIGMEALCDFVRPHADSLIEADKKMPQSIYNQPEFREQQIDSPLLALKCILMKHQGGAMDGIALGTLLGMKKEGRRVDDVLVRFDTDLNSFKMSCQQAHLVTWMEPVPFRELIASFARKFREP
jgi:tetratricopeptide (TPR) repeat protein